MPQSLSLKPDPRVRWMAEVTALAAAHSDPSHVAMRTARALRDTYGAAQVLVGHWLVDDDEGYEQHDDLGVELDPDAVFAVEPPDGADWWRALTPFPEAGGVALGLAVGMNGSGALAWRSSYDRHLDAGDVYFLRGLAHVAGNALERRAETDDRRLHMRRMVHARHQWEAAADAMAQGLLVLNSNGMVLRANRTIEAWGFPRMSTGAPLEQVLHPLQPDVSPAIRKVLAQARPGENHEFEAEYPLLSKCLRLTLRRISSDTAGDASAVLVLDDVTCQREAEEVLAEYNQRLEHAVRQRTAELNAANERLSRRMEQHREDRHALAVSEQRHAVLVENTLAGTALLREGTLTYCNLRFADIFRSSLAELFGRRSDELVQTDDRPLADWRTAPRDSLPDPARVRAQRADGAPLYLASSMVLINSHEGRVVLWNVLDMTREHLAEQALERSRTEMQELSLQILRTQEQERQRVAAELHDGIGQTLSAIKLAIANDLRASQCSSECIHLARAAERIQGAIEEVRRIAMDLRPSMIDDLGLLDTLEWFCREFAANNPDITLVRRVRVAEQEVRRELRIVIFRIVQEAVRNVVAHARAGELRLSLDKSDGMLHLIIADDGIGFTPNARESGSRVGFGLGSMRERAEQSGGHFALRSAPGFGTAIDVHWQ